MTAEDEEKIKTAMQFYDLMVRALKTTGVRQVVLTLSAQGEIWADAVTDEE